MSEGGEKEMNKKTKENLLAYVIAYILVSFALDGLLISGIALIIYKMKLSFL